MQIEVKIPFQFEVCKIRVFVQDEPTLTISAGSGEILSSLWRSKGDIQYSKKVVDRGSYAFYDNWDKKIGETVANYVPHTLSIGGGDYLEFEIKDGHIADWSPYFDEDYFDDWEWFPPE